MRVTAELLPGRETRVLDLVETATGYDLLKGLGAALDAHILVRGDVPIPVDEPFRDGERVRVISVVSGG